MSFFFSIQDLFGEGQEEVLRRPKISVATIKKIAARVLERMEEFWKQLQEPDNTYEPMNLFDDMEQNPI